ncbi:hypothetical protein [Carnobacterium antarcticum]|uniref:Uncharacterized protein n=1 Tax=Carnobacterium antarcticum TaxID=2126436 RepID=A0ABW4NMP2_9LACT|nr:hypothetical protein [Carnobacterium sp. CP1]
MSVEKIEQLRSNGFKFEEPNLLIKKLNQENDRFTTVLFVYVDDIDVVYINRYFMRGLETITEDGILKDHNQLNSNTKIDYVTTMQNLTFLKSRL